MILPPGYRPSSLILRSCFPLPALALALLSDGYAPADYGK
jgi:hypothetical protein